MKPKLTHVIMLDFELDMEEKFYLHFPNEKEFFYAHSPSPGEVETT